MAVGYYQRIPGHTVSLAEWWNGVAWQIRATPQPQGSTAGYLTGVSCTSGSSCMAVGYQYRRSGQASALAESWTGTTWVLRPVPRAPNSPDNYLLAVSCVTAHACTAVGSFTTSAYADRPWAARWSGVAWVPHDPPNPAKTRVAALLAVSCVSANQCVAVGYGENSLGRSKPLAESWRLSRWTIEAAAVPAGGSTSYLYGVDCPADDDCTAVGYFHTPVGDDETLAEKWGAGIWRIQRTPNPATSMDTYLNSVSCIGLGTCLSVGSSGVLLAREHTLGEIRAAGKWTIQLTANP
jgi:hypothetical protein